MSKFPCQTIRIMDQDDLDGLAANEFTQLVKARTAHIGARIAIIDELVGDFVFSLPSMSAQFGELRGEPKLFSLFFGRDSRI
jgi:hypothetical protein